MEWGATRTLGSQGDGIQRATSLSQRGSGPARGLATIPGNGRGREIGRSAIEKMGEKNWTGERLRGHQPTFWIPIGKPSPPAGSQWVHLWELSVPFGV